MMRVVTEGTSVGSISEGCVPNVDLDDSQRENENSGDLLTDKPVS